MALFEVIAPTADAAALPGPWQARPTAAQSFSTRSDPDAGAMIWRVELSGDVALAQAELAAADSSLRAQESALEHGLSRMQQALGAASFSRAATAPERELQAMIGNMYAPAGAASFSTNSAPATPGTDWAAAAQKLQAFTAQVQASISHYAIVETRQNARLIGRSSIGWTGDMRSLLIADLSAEQHALHARTLQLALRSRAALIRTFTMITRGAAIVATAISSPAGPLLALPAAWKFVDELLQEQH